MEIPKIRLPVKVDIIKHKKEIDGKSTSSHAKMIAPDDVEIYEFPNFPDYTKEPPGDIILIFPSSRATSICKSIQSFHCINKPSMLSFSCSVQRILEI